MSNQTFTFDKDQNLTANAFTRSYTVSYNGNGGSVATTSQAANATFNGWATTATGSGCVGLAVAANAPNCRVVLADLSEGALRLCKQNVRRNSLNARVTCVSANALEAPSSVLWDFDVIACNPPYIPTGDIEGLDVSVKEFEPLMALDGGVDGLDFYRIIASKWKSALRLGGTLIFEVGIDQAEAVAQIMTDNGFENIITTEDAGGIQRVVEGIINN